MNRIGFRGEWRVTSLLLGSAFLYHCSSQAPAVDSTPPFSESSPSTPAPMAPAPTSNGPAPAPVMSTPGGTEMNPMPTALVPGENPTPPVATPTVPQVPAPGPKPFDGPFILGADISSVPEAISGGRTFVDTDGQQKSVVELLRNHGFNFIRLRTFVNPSAQYGYASGSGCRAKTEAFDDKEHTIAFAREIKAAGMGLLLDFHYSDTWADPGKQVIPEAWRGITTLAGLADQVHAYTVDVISALVAAGARPDMVAVGNEITPGMLIHVPTANTDCFGNNPAVNQAVNGSQNNWDNLATLLKAGIDGVRQVDAGISVMLHIENTESAGGVINWVQNAQSRGVAFDVLGLSAYEAFQGPASEWRATLTRLAGTFPDLQFAIAEYNPQRRLLNDIMHELPGGRGVGTFFWEPTQGGSQGAAMFTRQGNDEVAIANDFAVYDQIRTDFGL